jgi:hypothetical protein
MGAVLARDKAERDEPDIFGTLIAGELAPTGLGDLCCSEVSSGACVLLKLPQITCAN